MTEEYPVCSWIGGRQKAMKVAWEHIRKIGLAKATKKDFAQGIKQGWEEVRKCCPAE